MHAVCRLLVLAIACGLGLSAIAPASASERVAFHDNHAPGTIVVRTGERRLYLVLGGGQALRYVVGVGREGAQWTGASSIEGKFIRPHWAPPPEMRLTRPDLPAVIPSGSPANPMGAAAMTLAGGAYAIHGTNRPESIGGFVSAGCIRMHNEDIMDLYDRVSVGTPVLVVR